jgi:hypothetical protein
LINVGLKKLTGKLTSPVKYPQMKIEGDRFSGSGEMASLSHHQRMVEAWTHKRFRLEHVLETLRLFLLPMNLCRDGNVVVVGSGVGTRVAAMRYLGVDAFGLELNPEVISMTINEARGFNYQGNLLNRDDLGRFKPFYLASDDVLEHLSREDILGFLHLARDLGVQQMVHSVTTLEHSDDINNDPSHITKLSAIQWRELLGTNGWRVVGNSKKGERFGVFHLVRA